MTGVQTCALPICMALGGEKAYAASPSFSLLKPYLEGPALDSLGPLCFSETGIHGSHGTWWIFALKAAVGNESFSKNAKDLNAFYEKCARELDEALRSGRIPSRYAFSAFMDPDIALYVKIFPVVFKQYMQKIYESSYVASKNIVSPEDKFIIDTYDKMALRRNYLSNNYFAGMEGKVLSAISSVVGPCSAFSLWLALAVQLSMVFYGKVLSNRHLRRSLAGHVFLIAAFLSAVALCRLLFFTVFSTYMGPSSVGLRFLLFYAPVSCVSFMLSLYAFFLYYKGFNISKE